MNEQAQRTSRLADTMDALQSRDRRSGPDGSPARRELVRGIADRSDSSMISHRDDESITSPQQRNLPADRAAVADPTHGRAHGETYSGQAHPGPHAISMLQRSVGNRAVAAFLAPSAGRTDHPKLPAQLSVQRAVNKKGTFMGWGGTNEGNVMVNANAAVDVTEGAAKVSHPVWFASDAVESIEVEAGATGNIMLKLPWYWHHHGIVQEPGRIYGTNEKHIFKDGGPIDYWVSSAFTVGEDGKVIFGAQSSGGTLGALGYLDGSATVTPTGGDGSGSMTVNVTFKALQSTTTTDTSGRATTGTASGGVTGSATPAGVGGSVTGGGSYGVTESYSHAAGVTLTGTTAITCSFGINIKVKPPQKITKSQVIRYSADGKFLSGDEGITGVYEWWRTIPEPIKELISAGKRPVRIRGRASQTGTPSQNEKVIAKRIGDVTTRLRNVAAGMNVIPDSGFTDQNERSVAIWVEYTTGEAKVAATPTVQH